ncbi:hypothetical protein AB0L65_24025 [Nonomuraea sp. NPDC052116]|uniref:hypothetical protein n=1 Tax=Nonomuraea sp. NPDC052116 TaxID=3155665 RepID=UPI003436185E
MTQVIPLPAWQELRGLVTDERAEPVSSPWVSRMRDLLASGHRPRTARERRER